MRKLAVNSEMRPIRLFLGMKYWLYIIFMSYVCDMGDMGGICGMGDVGWGIVTFFTVIFLRLSLILLSASSCASVKNSNLWSPFR